MMRTGAGEFLTDISAGMSPRPSSTELAALQMAIESARSKPNDCREKSIISTVGNCIHKRCIDLIYNKKVVFLFRSGLPLTESSLRVWQSQLFWPRTTVREISIYRVKSTRHKSESTRRF